MILSFLALAGNSEAQQAKPVKPTLEFHCLSDKEGASLEFDLLVYSQGQILSSVGIDRVNLRNIKSENIAIASVDSRTADMVSVASPPGFADYFFLTATAEDDRSNTRLSLASAVKIREPINGGTILRDEDFRATGSLEISRGSEKRSISFDCVKIKGTTFS